MKKSLFFLFLFLMIPFTLTAAEKEQTVMITLNQLHYIPHYTPLIRDGVLYISCVDLADMTYSSFTDDADQITLTIQNKVLAYQKQKKLYTCNGLTFLPKHPLYISKDQVPYFPVTMLDKICYPYSYSDHQLSLQPAMPYSTSTDTYECHQLYPIRCSTYEDLLTSFLDPAAAKALVLDCKKNDRYFSLITAEHKKECLKQMQKQLTLPKAYYVYFRQLVQDSSGCSLSGFERLPLACKIHEDGISLNLDNKTLSYNCFWSAYQPLNRNVAIDLNKSLDMMIMRTLYEYYRNSFDMKDDITIIPISQITYDRSDHITYTVYFGQDPLQQKYQLILYKQTNGSLVNYYIDLLPAK